MVEKKSLDKYKYAAIVGGSTIVAAILLFFVGIRPLYITAGNVTNESKEKQEKLDLLEDKKAKLEQLKDRETQLKEDSDRVAAALPEGKDVGRLFIQLEELARNAGGTVTSVGEGGDSSSSQQYGSLKKVSYTMPLALPSYFNFKQFITSAESALRLMQINDISLDSNNGQINTNITVETFTR